MKKKQINERFKIAINVLLGDKELSKTNIAATLGKMKQPHQHLVGFALETNNEMENAQKKLHRKNLDFIVLNSLSDAGAGFRHDTNKITIINKEDIKEYPLKTKSEVAKDIIDELAQIISR